MLSGDNSSFLASRDQNQQSEPQPVDLSQSREGKD